MSNLTVDTAGFQKSAEQAYEIVKQVAGHRPGRRQPSGPRNGRIWRMLAAIGPYRQFQRRHGK